jgi:hypothetical protein
MATPKYEISGAQYQVVFQDVDKKLTWLSDEAPPLLWLHGPDAKRLAEKTLQTLRDGMLERFVKITGDQANPVRVYSSPSEQNKDSTTLRRLLCECVTSLIEVENRSELLRGFSTQEQLKGLNSGHANGKKYRKFVKALAWVYETVHSQGLHHRSTDLMIMSVTR